MFIDDLPYLQILLLGILYLSCLVLIGRVSKIIPRQPDKQISRPVDIPIQVIEDIKHEKEIGKERPFLQKDKEKPKPKLFVETLLQEKRKPISIKMEKPIHAETLPGPSGRLKIPKKTLTHVKPDIPKATVFGNSVQSDEINFRAPLLGKRNFETTRTEAELPFSETITSIKQHDDTAEIIFQSKGFQRNYADDGEDQKQILYHRDVGTSVKVFTSGQPVGSDEIPLPEADHTERPYLIEKNIRPSGSRASLQAGNNLFSLERQQDTPSEGEKLNITPLHRLRIQTYGAEKSEGNPMHAGLHQQPLDLSGDINIDEIDLSQLISLKEFNVCIDPEEEFKLKMQLATLLDKPARCRIDSILFFFKYIESAYTIKVDIYDPQKTLSGDRCSVLGRAIECVKN